MKFYIPYLRLENLKTTSSLVAHDPLYQTRREKGEVGGGGCRCKFKLVEQTPQPGLLI